MLKLQGTCTLKVELKHTEYYWGELTEIQGKTFPYIEFAVDKSSCMILVKGKGLVDVNINDVESYEAYTNSNAILFDLLNSLFKD